jgi:D-xylose transport system permease protein
VTTDLIIQPAGPARPAPQPETAAAVAWRDLSLVGVLLAVVAFFAATAPQFLSARNLSLLTTEFAITAVLALGMLLVILPGHIDLSAGSGVGLLGGVAAVLIMRLGLPAPLAILASFALGLCIWRAMGTVIVTQGIPAFIITLGGLLVQKGLFWLIIRNQTVPISPGGAPNLLSILTTYYLPPGPSYALGAAVIAALGFAQYRAYRAQIEEGLFISARETRGVGEAHSALPREGAPLDSDWELHIYRFLVPAQGVAVLVITTCQFRGLPLPALILAAVALAVHVLTRHTPFGRALYAIGGNEEAAFLSGIPVARVVLAAYTLMGALVALTGLLQTAYAGASTTTVGELMELDAVAACVIGGASLRGGRGTVAGVLLGALLMATLLSGMALLAVPPEARFIARGLVLALAAWLDVRLSGRR